VTEADWLTSVNPDAMLDHIEGRTSDRKLRLFACACCRRVWSLVTVPACREAVLVAERFADGLASLEECTAAHKAAQHAKPLTFNANWAAAWTAAPKAIQAAAETANLAAQTLATIAAQTADRAARASVCTGAPIAERSAAWAAFDDIRSGAAAGAQARHAELLREIVGNPFAAPRENLSFSSATVRLAEAIYAGEDCTFALYDSLLEDGHTDLAQHFTDPDHPKGCWAIDVILGRD